MNLETSGWLWRKAAISDGETISGESQAIVLISTQGLFGPEPSGYQAARDDRASINLIKLARPQLIITAQMIITGQIGLIFQGVLSSSWPFPLPREILAPIKLNTEGSWDGWECKGSRLHVHEAWLCGSLM